jgi:hypothetical protein
VTERGYRSRRNPSHGTDWYGSDVRFWTSNASQAWTTLDHSQVKKPGLIIGLLSSDN